MIKIKIEKNNLINLNEAYYKILYWFFSYPTKEFSLNELVNAVKLSKTTVNKVVIKLSKEGFLNIKHIGNYWRISCNQRHPYNNTKKVVYNLEMIYNLGIVDLLLKKYNNIRTIILFGSYRKGDDIDTSDIDIAIEVLDNEEIKIINFGIIPLFGYRKNVKINILKFNRNKIDINLFSNIANGIVLHGFLEVKL
jgi:predicted nucleotidyltransferase